MDELVARGTASVNSGERVLGNRVRLSDEILPNQAPRNQLDLESHDPPIVLVVEDEGLVRMVAAEMLLDAGFQVLEATTADEAMGLLASGPKVDLVFTDIDMPGTTDGIGLTQWVRNHWPQIGLVVASGVHGAGVQDLPPEVPFLTKPYLEHQLLRAITAVIERRQR